MMKTLSLHMQTNNGVSTNMGIVYVAPVQKYISWCIYQTTKCNVIIIKIVISNNSFFRNLLFDQLTKRSFCASTVKFNADFTKGTSY